MPITLPPSPAGFSHLTETDLLALYDRTCQRRQRLQQRHPTARRWYRPCLTRRLKQLDQRLSWRIITLHYLHPLDGIDLATWLDAWTEAPQVMLGGLLYNRVHFSTTDNLCVRNFFAVNKIREDLPTHLLRLHFLGHQCLTHQPRQT